MISPERCTWRGKTSNQVDDGQQLICECRRDPENSSVIKRYSRAHSVVNARDWPRAGGTHNAAGVFGETRGETRVSRLPLAEILLVAIAPRNSY